MQSQTRKKNRLNVCTYRKNGYFTVTNIRYFKNLVFMSERRDVFGRQRFLNGKLDKNVIVSFRMRPIQSLEKSVCSSDCDQKRNQDFGKRERA